MIYDTLQTNIVIVVCKQFHLTCSWKLLDKRRQVNTCVTQENLIFLIISESDVEERQQLDSHIYSHMAQICLLA